MQPSMMIMVCLLVVTCKSDLSLIVHYNERSSWLISLDNYHLDSFLQCLCLETTIECNLRLNTSSGNATEMEMRTRNQSETTSQFFNRYVCTFFYSNHSVVCKRQSCEFYDNSTALFLVDSTSMCPLSCVEWSWTAQQNSTIYKINNNNDITLRYNETNLTCNSTTTKVASVTSTPVTTKTTVTSTMAENDSQVTTTVFTKHDINEGDAKNNDSTWIIIGVVIGGAAILALVVVAIVLCRRRCERAKPRPQQENPQESNWKHVDNRARNNDQGYSNVNVVTDQTTNDWRGGRSNPAFNHISPDQLDLGHMPFIKILVENKVYLNQSSDGHSPVKSNSDDLRSHTNKNKHNDNVNVANGYRSEPTQIHLLKTGYVGTYSNKTTEPVSTYSSPPVDPVGTYSNVHVEPASTYSSTPVDPVGAYTNVHVEPASTYSNIQMQNQLPEEQNASSLTANTSLPQYSLAAVINTYPVINHLTSAENEDTAHTPQLYDKLGEKAAPKQNGYDYISDTMIA